MPFYIRLLRPPLLTAFNCTKQPKGSKTNKPHEQKARQAPPYPLTIAYTLTVCTDLGESFLDPADDAQKIKLEVQYRSKQEARIETLGKEVVRWTHGMRVFNGKVGIRQDANLETLLSKLGQGEIWVHIFAVEGSRNATTIGISQGLMEAGILDNQGPIYDRGDYLGPHKSSTVVPEIVSVWARVSVDEQVVKAQLGQDVPVTETERLVLRKFKIPAGRVIPSKGTEPHRETSSQATTEIQIWEEMGESIARHVWDAALALVAYLSQVIPYLHGDTDGDGISMDDVPSRYSLKKSLRNALFADTTIQIVELGSGCGIVGLAISQLLSNFVHRLQVVLTDLPEAMEILNRNIAETIAGSTLQCNVEIQKRILDWDEALKSIDDVQQSKEDPDRTQLQPDLVVISDCTYNADSLPALVHTIVGLLENKPISEVEVLVSLKRRHASEDAFFALMNEARFKIVRKEIVPLADRARQKRSEEREAVEIYWFARDVEIDTR